MDTVSLHPMIVHLPMALAFLMPMVAGGILWAIWRGYFPQRTWLLVCGLQLAMFAGCLLAMRSGETDEERVEEVVAEAALEAHEEAAELFTWGSGLLLVMTVLPLLFRSQGRIRGAGILTLAGALVLLGLGYRVGAAGGALVYQHGAGAAFSQDAEDHGGEHEH